MEENNTTKDKFKAMWLSHSSIADFLKCPRLYYLRNVYKDPRNNHKITVMTPSLALGQIVHEIIESLSCLPLSERFLISPLDQFDEKWMKVSGEKGGFKNDEQEAEYKERGVKMLKNIIDNPGPVAEKAVKIKSENGLPFYWFSEKENIILCGKIDWIQYLPKSDSIHIIDFKTGRREEDESSLQLPIYFLLASNTQKRTIKKASYWYLDKEDGLIEKKLPTLKEAEEKVEKIADRIKLARKLNHFECSEKGCKYCYPMERVFKNYDVKKVAVSTYGQDIYILIN